MIKLLLKHKIFELSINILFDGLISTFNRSGIIKVSNHDLTPEMVGKQVVFVESATGYDYILPSPLEKGTASETAVWFKPWMRYTIKGKRRYRSEYKCIANTTRHYYNSGYPHRTDTDRYDDYTWNNMIFYIDMNS